MRTPLAVKLFYSDYNMINFLKLILGCFFVGLPICIYAASAKITNIQITNTHLQTHISIQLSSPSEPHIFTLTHPDRLVFDFSNMKLAMQLKTLSFNPKIIKDIRGGENKPGVLRLVFDMNYPFNFKTITLLPAKQIVVSLNITKNKIAENKPLLKPQIASNKPVVSKKEAPTVEIHPLVVIIDPGHGGKDTGAIGAQGTKEKDVVLKISKQLASLVNQAPRMRAVLTRDGDYYVTLHNRLVYARKNKADIYISIHADSYFNNWASGASVYALSKNGATSIAARWLARRDNYSELGGVALGQLEDQSPLLRSVLIDLAQTATVTDSMRLGSALLDAMDNITMLHYSRVEQAPFMVLKSPDIPSVLVETGFISNSAEELRLRSNSYQHKIAVSLFNGIRHYQKNMQ